MRAILPVCSCTLSYSISILRRRVGKVSAGDELTDLGAYLELEYRLRKSLQDQVPRQHAFRNALRGGAARSLFDRARNALLLDVPWSPVERLRP